jgi:hypothetical protein
MGDRRRNLIHSGLVGFVLGLIVLVRVIEEESLLDDYFV